jgi:hypothetical protein
MGEIFRGAKQKGREVGVLLFSRTEVQNASMAGIRIHLHTLHNKIGKTETGINRVALKFLFVWFRVSSILIKVLQDISRYFKIFLRTWRQRPGHN